MIAALRLIYPVCALAGFAAGVLVTRYAPECREGFCWGQSPFLLMFVGGALTAFAARSRAPAVLPVMAGMLAGALVGLCVSFGGGLYAFLGGSTGFARPAPPSAMALVPNPIIGALGGILGLMGAAIVVLVRRSLSWAHRPK